MFYMLNNDFLYENFIIYIIIKSMVRSGLGVSFFMHIFLKNKNNNNSFKRLNSNKKNKRSKI